MGFGLTQILPLLVMTVCDSQLFRQQSTRGEVSEFQTRGLGHGFGFDSQPHTTVVGTHVELL